MNRPPMAFRPDDLSRRPRVSAADVRALLWLIAFAMIVLGVNAVDPMQVAR